MYYDTQMLLMPIGGISTMLNTIITARGSRGMVFAENLMMTCVQVVSAVVFIVILKLGFWGFLLGGIPVTLLHVVIQFWLLRKCGFFIGLEKDSFRPDCANSVLYTHNTAKTRESVVADTTPAGLFSI